MSGKDRSDFEAALLAHLDSLYNFARWLTGSETEAKDLVQDTYLRALRAHGQFQPETNLRAWPVSYTHLTLPTNREV